MAEKSAGRLKWRDVASLNLCRLRGAFECAAMIDAMLGADRLANDETAILIAHINTDGPSASISRSRSCRIDRPQLNRSI
jgi:hypothetical protein